MTLCARGWVWLSRNLVVRKGRPAMTNTNGLLESMEKLKIMARSMRKSALARCISSRMKTGVTLFSV